MPTGVQGDLVEQARAPSPRARWVLALSGCCPASSLLVRALVQVDFLRPNHKLQNEGLTRVQAGCLHARSRAGPLAEVGGRQLLRACDEQPALRAVKLDPYSVFIAQCALPT